MENNESIEAYHKSLEDDATSTYHESLPFSFFSIKLNPSSSPNVKEDQVNLLVPDTPKDFITFRAKTNPKKHI